jgi:hypothetical protein
MEREKFIKLSKIIVRDIGIINEKDMYDGRVIGEREILLSADNGWIIVREKDQPDLEINPIFLIAKAYKRFL